MSWYLNAAGHALEADAEQLLEAELRKLFTAHPEFGTTSSSFGAAGVGTVSVHEPAELPQRRPEPEPEDPQPTGAAAAVATGPATQLGPVGEDGQPPAPASPEAQASRPL